MRIFNSILIHAKVKFHKQKLSNHERANLTAKVFLFFVTHVDLDERIFYLSNWRACRERTNYLVSGRTDVRAAGGGFLRGVGGSVGEHSR